MIWTSLTLPPSVYIALHFLVHFREAVMVERLETTLTVGDIPVTKAASTASSTTSTTLLLEFEPPWWMKKSPRIRLLWQLRKLQVEVARNRLLTKTNDILDLLMERGA
jgi:hypothetical protein